MNTNRVEQNSATRVSLLLRLRDAADAQAWREFDERYGPLILAYCRTRGMQQTDAEDVRQLVMSKLARRLRTFDYCPETGGFRRYLRTVTRGELSRHAARVGVLTADLHFNEDYHGNCSEAPEDDDVWEREWMRHHFRIAWATVKTHCDEQSLDVFRQLLAGAPSNRVALSMGMTEPAVRKVKQRICDRLKAAIAEQILDEEQ